MRRSDERGGSEFQEMRRMRIGDFGIKVGGLPAGPLNKISDVPGVTVGHCTVVSQTHNTGVTVVLPGPGNPFAEKRTAAAFVLNGFGKTAGLVQIDELGTLETPIALTNTLNVGRVHDAMVEYMCRICQRDGISLTSVNPVVCECNDASLNAIRHRAVGEAQVFQAIESAKADFEEGAVGCGRGMTCHGLKGGVGSASRVMTLDGEKYTLGVLVQSNHGRLQDLLLEGRPVGREIQRQLQESAPDKGSCIVILATDLPLSDRQLRRILKRCAVGLARNGSYFGHGSGDVMIGFTTANRVPHGGMHRVIAQQVLTEHTLEFAFRAAAEATQEAVLNSLTAAVEMTGLNGRVYESITKYL